MRLARLAVVTLSDEHAERKPYTMTDDDAGVRVDASPIRDASDYLLFGTVGLAQLPEVRGDGVVVVPSRPREEVEAKIEAFAELLAVCRRCAHTVRSHRPYVGFIAESPDEQHISKLRAGSNCLPSPNTTC